MKIFVPKFLVKKKSVFLSLIVLSCSYAIHVQNIFGALPTNFPTEPLAQAAIPQPDQQNQAPGPETVALSDEAIGEYGNWVKKKQWLLKAFEVNDNIYKLAVQIADTRKLYSNKNDAISDELHNFYTELGIEQGKLQEMFESVERYLEKKKKKDIAQLSSLNPQKNEIDRDYQFKVELLENQIKRLKDELEQLKLDIKSIDDIGKSLIQRLEKADEQISSSLSLAESSKGKMESIWEIVDDKKARQIYYELVGIEENLKAALNYLKDVLAVDFDQVVGTSKKQITITKDAVKKLEDKGLIIRDRSKRLEQLKLQEMQKLEKEKESAEKAAILSKENAEQKPQPAEEGFVKKIYNRIVVMVATIGKYFIIIRQKVESFFVHTSSAAQPDASKNLTPPAQSTTSTPTSSAATSATTPVIPANTPQVASLQSAPATLQTTTSTTNQAQQSLSMPTM